MIKIENLVKRYGNIVALDHFNLEIEEGEIFGLLGPNGSGKTTAINCMLALLKYDRGSIRIMGREMTPDNYDVKRQIGIVMQDVAVFDELNVHDNIDYFCSLYIKDKNKRKELVEDAIRFVGLEDYRKTYPKKLSGGLLRRLNIACGIAHKPRLIILDEPTVGLDPEERIHFRNLFSHMAQNRLVLLSTHIIEDVQSVCGQIVVIHHGRILFAGTPEQLIRSAEGHVGVFWEKDAAQERGLSITARVNTGQGIRCRAVGDRLPDYVRAEEPTLEDAYLYLISREAAQ